MTTFPKVISYLVSFHQDFIFYLYYKVIRINR